MVGQGRLADLEERYELAHADLAGVLSQHVHELHADRVAEGLGDCGHSLGLLALHVRVDHGFATRLTGRPLLLWRQLQIDGHRCTDIN